MQPTRHFHHRHFQHPHHPPERNHRQGFRGVVPISTRRVNVERISSLSVHLRVNAVRWRPSNEWEQRFSIVSNTRRNFSLSQDARVAERCQFFRAAIVVVFTRSVWVTRDGIESVSLITEDWSSPGSRRSALYSVTHLLHLVTIPALANFHTQPQVFTTRYSRATTRARDPFARKISHSLRSLPPLRLQWARPEATLADLQAQLENLTSVPPHTQKPATNYKFYRTQSLQHLPNPQRALDLLDCLANDPAVQHVMQEHKFAVGTLTELTPHEPPNLLSLNKNAEAVILLRLRTDAYDGFRLYADIRRVLCHELTHNVWGNHGDLYLPHHPPKLTVTLVQSTQLKTKQRGRRI